MPISQQDRINLQTFIVNMTFSQSTSGDIPYCINCVEDKVSGFDKIQGWRRTFDYHQL